MIAFDVTYSRVNDSEATAGGTNRHGFASHDETLRDAVDTCRGFTSSMSESNGRHADCSDARRSRYFTIHWNEWDTGDAVETSIHFPTNTTPASRSRLVRLLERIA